MSSSTIFILPEHLDLSRERLVISRRRLKVFGNLTYRQRQAMRRCMAYVTSRQMYEDYLTLYPDEADAELRRKGYNPARMSTGLKVTALRLIDGD